MWASWARFSRDGTLLPLGSKLCRAALSVADAPLNFPGHRLRHLLTNGLQGVTVLLGEAGDSAIWGPRVVRSPAIAPAHLPGDPVAYLGREFSLLQWFSIYLVRGSRGLPGRGFA